MFRWKSSSSYLPSAETGVKKGRIIEISGTGEFRKWNPGFPEDPVSDEELRLASSPHYLDTSMGKTIGTHNGAHFFTIGQRKGMNIGGHIEPLFVIGTDVEKNIVYVGEGQAHPGLFRKGLFYQG